MDSKALSSISDCFGDLKAIKTPKLNTIWLELIARVLNMLIGLKDDNYYSKVFKIVNYKLSNSTFWVIITHVIHNLNLFIVSRALSSRLRVIHVIHTPKLFTVSRVLSSQPTVVHVNHSLELLIACQALSSWLDVIHVIHNPELFIRSITQSSIPGVVHVIHNP